MSLNSRQQARFNKFMTTQRNGLDLEFQFPESILLTAAGKGANGEIGPQDLARQIGVCNMGNLLKFVKDGHQFEISASAFISLVDSVLDSSVKVEDLVARMQRSVVDQGDSVQQLSKENVQKLLAVVGVNVDVDDEVIKNIMNQVKKVEAVKEVGSEEPDVNVLPEDVHQKVVGDDNVGRKPVAQTKDGTASQVIQE